MKPKKITLNNSHESDNLAMKSQSTDEEKKALKEQHAASH